MKEILAILVILSLFIACALAFTSCTYSINMVHTQGYADDVVDETQSAEPDVTTDLSVPATAL